VDVLIDDGLVRRQQGSGTFVNSLPIEYPISKCTRFTENLSQKNKLTESQLLKKVVLPARGGVASRLELATETSVIWLETLRVVEDQPFCMISHFLSQTKFEFVMDEFEGGSLHQLLIDQNIIPLRRLSLVTSMLPMGEDANYLQMPNNKPVLRIKSVNVDEKTGKPVEYSVTRFRADRVQLNIAIS
jgi:GntR family phosphonate transport system transcriptional regulator